MLTKIPSDLQLGFLGEPAGLRRGLLMRSCCSLDRQTDAQFWGHALTGCGMLCVCTPSTHEWAGGGSGLYSAATILFTCPSEGGRKAACFPRRHVPWLLSGVPECAGQSTAWNLLNVSNLFKFRTNMTKITTHWW